MSVITDMVRPSSIIARLCSYLNVFDLEIDMQYLDPRHTVKTKLGITNFSIFGEDNICATKHFEKILCVNSSPVKNFFLCATKYIHAVHMYICMEICHR